jgi:hypothetical protein
MDISKGKPETVTVKFSSRGAPAVFINPPMWTLYNSEDKVMLTGAAVPNGNTWQAQITVSNNYVVPGGKEPLILQFTGYDNKNASYTRDVELTLIDTDEGFKADGIIYNVLSPGISKDTILLPTPVASYTVKIFDPTGAQVGPTVSHASENYASANSGGYLYSFNLPVLDIKANSYLDPYQIMIEYSTSAGDDYELHPLYILDMKSINLMTSIRQYLDKAKLVEIDPSLQWQPTELLQSMLEGYKYVNASPPEGTFWTPAAYPSTIDQYLIWAALFYALNMRYLAEGMQSFDFSGLNTTLTYNRTEALSTKMGEIQGLLGTLTDAKRSAINIFGKGSAPAGTADMRRRNLGTNGYSIGLMTNRRNLYGWRRYTL